MIEKQRGVATTDYVCFEDSEYNEKYSCNIRDGKAYAFLFGDNYNHVFFSDSCGTHAGILLDEFGINIYANDKKFEEGLKFIQTHTNGRIFVKKKIITCRPWSLLTKKESQELIKRAKINLGVDISDFMYCISDSDVKDIKKQNVECDLYLIKLNDYINCNFSSLEDVKSKYNQIKRASGGFSKTYDEFDMTDRNGNKMGVGRLGYHLTAYQEGKEYRYNKCKKTKDMKPIKNFEEFVNENKDFERRHDSEMVLKKLMSALSNFERDVITYHFGLFGKEKMSNLEIAQKIGLYEPGYDSMEKSEERVKRILIKALKRLKLRGNGFEKTIRDILYDSYDEEDEQIKDFLDSEGVEIRDFDNK